VIRQREVEEQRAMSFVQERRRSSSSSVSSSSYYSYGTSSAVEYDDDRDTHRRGSHGFAHVPMGGGDIGPAVATGGDLCKPLLWVTHEDVGYGATAAALPTNPYSCRGTSIAKSERSTVRVAYCIVAMSWLAALYLTGQSHYLIYRLQGERRAHKIQLTEQQQSWHDLRIELEGETNYVSNLNQTRTALEHEVHIIREFSNTDEIRMSPTPRQNDPSPEVNDHLISSWLSHRRYGLEKRVRQLQHYLQQFSRREVAERFGPGPHRVRITIDFAANRSGDDESDDVVDTKATASSSDLRSFVVELAPLSDMPHSVHFFLEMVQLGIWKDTVFLHHESNDHVVPAIPMDYQRHIMKHHHLGALGWKGGLGFLEHDGKWNHGEYTIGFTNRGPTFYVNAVDNGSIHGPGGNQAHHVLEDDADPCFGRVVQGRDVVDQLIELGSKKIQRQQQEQQRVEDDDEEEGEQSSSSSSDWSSSSSSSDDDSDAGSDSTTAAATKISISASATQQPQQRSGPSYPWSNEEHSLSRIASIEILPR